MSREEIVQTVMPDGALVNGKVVLLPFALKVLRREVRLTGRDDSLVNNTSDAIALEDAQGKHLRMLIPGEVYQPEGPATVYFSADPRYSFRSYLNG